MLAMALLIVPTVLAPLAGACGPPYWWSASPRRRTKPGLAKVYTLASDMFPRAAVGSVVGIGAFAGASRLGVQRSPAGFSEANGNDYTPILIVCGLAYVSAWTIIHLLAPRLEPARAKENARA